MVFERFLVGVDNSQTQLFTFPANVSDYWRPVILISAMPTLFIGSAARRIGKVEVNFHKVRTHLGVKTQRQ